MIAPRSLLYPRTLLQAATLAALLALGACNEVASSAKPPAVVMTDDALGYYCQMYLADHPGPKAQILVKGDEHPLWFTQVVDAVAYLKGRERVADTAAIYVSDMGAAKSWSEPGRANWIDADKAVFVIGSRRLGGMGVPEAIPFSTALAAAEFVAAHGGRAMGLADIPEAYVRHDGAASADAGTTGGSDGMGGMGDRPPAATGGAPAPSMH
jgi:copper chaperone NosL